MLNLAKPRGLQNKAAQSLLHALVGQARDPYFYAQLKVPDTLDGRFDLLVLHAWLVLARLRASGQGDLAQRLTDRLFESFDEGLRELGAGDIGIGRRIKKMASAFYGRLSAYDGAGDEQALQAALLRNVYRGDGARTSEAVALARYAIAQRDVLAAAPLASGEISFAPVCGDRS
jgi:cytochrome b pre-mRNA-processing protein 3